MNVEKVINTLPTDEDNNVVMELYNCFISPEGFIKRFDGNGASLSYEWLYNHKKTTPTWKNQFESWKEQGLID
ncbi:hypothetical protein GCM10028778_11680 [Barrientosiimonas marina]|uniref:Transposase n=1 Tax=Lentibacillus kimchii TaxID=1542911 RepID=A0ABW2UWR6_9BACI